MAANHDATLALTTTRIHTLTTGSMSRPLKASILFVMIFLPSHSIPSLPLMRTLDIPPVMLHSAILHPLAFDSYIVVISVVV